MSVRIIDKAAEKVVGVRVVGPYPQTIPQGSQQLLAWRQRHGVPFGKWLVLYWDDPAEVAPEKLRADVVISVADDFALPAGSMRFTTCASAMATSSGCGASSTRSCCRPAATSRLRG